MFHLLSRTAALLATGLALGFGVNTVRPNGVPIGPVASAAQCSVTAGTAAKPTALVPVVEVLAPALVAPLCADATALVADARTEDRFSAGHISGAIHLPCGAAGDVASQALQQMAGKKTVVVYGDSTEEAQKVAASVKQRLPNPWVRVIAIAGGFSAWQAAGLACAAGPCPTCGLPTFR